MKGKDHTIGWYLSNMLWIIIQRVFPSKLYLSIRYRLIFGRWIDWDNPRYFTEKLQWLKLYYYGEKVNVELLEDNFTIELPKEEEPQNPPFIVLTKSTHLKLTIPMLITIGDYQFVDTSVNISMEIEKLKAGTYTYKFMYDDQEFEITYTIVDVESE